LARSIPWPRVLAEGIAIVASILLAFAIQAWWDARSERQLEQEYLSAIHVEIEGALAEVQRDLATLQETGRALDEFFVDAPLPSHSLRRLLALASVVPNIAPPTAVLDDLVASGRLQLIRSSAVREQLMLFRQDMAKSQLNEEAHRTFVNERLLPYLSDATPLVGTLSRSPWGDAESEASESDFFHSSSDADLLRLQGTASFQNMMLERERALARVLPVVERTERVLLGLERLLAGGPG
jgi:hypothetical protein